MWVKRMDNDFLKNELIMATGKAGIFNNDNRVLLLFFDDEEYAYQIHTEQNNVLCVVETYKGHVRKCLLDCDEVSYLLIEDGENVE